MSFDGRETRSSRRAGRSRTGMREFSGAVLKRLSAAELRDLLFGALLLSLTGEVASVFAAETVLVVVFFVVTVFLCAATWRAEA